MNNLEDFLNDIKSHLFNFFNERDLAINERLYGAFILDSLFDVLTPYFNICMILIMRKDFSLHSAKYFDLLVTYLKLDSIYKNQLTNAPKSYYILNPENRSNLIELLYNAKDATPSEIERKVNKRKALKEHIKEIHKMLQSLSKLLRQNNGIVRLKAMFLLYILNNRFHLLDIGDENHVSWNSHYTLTYLMCKNQKIDRVSKVQICKNFRELIEYSGQKIANFKQHTMNHLLNILNSLDVPLKEDTDIFNDSLWQAIIKIDCVKEVINSPIICQSTMIAGNKYEYFSKAENMEYIKLFKRHYGITEIEELLQEKKIKSSVARKKLQIEGLEFNERYDDNQNPFLKFSFDKDVPLMSTDRNYYCPLKLLRLDHVQAVLQILYAVDNDYISDADVHIIKKLIPDFIPFDNSMEYYIYFFNQIEPFMKEIGNKPSEDAINFFCPCNNNQIDEKKQIEQVKKFKAYLYYLYEEVKTVESAQESSFQVTFICHSAKDYYKIFDDLCCYRKSSAQGYFSMEYCKSSIVGEQTKQQIECRNKFESTMKNLIISEAKRSFSPCTYAPTKFSSIFLSEKTIDVLDIAANDMP